MTSAGDTALFVAKPTPTPTPATHVFARTSLKRVEGEFRVSLALNLGAGGTCVAAAAPAVVVDPTDIVPKLESPAPAATVQKRSTSFSRRLLGAASKLGKSLPTPRGVANSLPTLTPRSEESTPRERKRYLHTVEVERPSRDAPLDVKLVDVPDVGCVVASVQEGGLCEAGGLKPGDVILTCGSWPVELASDATSVLKRTLGEIEMTVSRIEGNGLPRGWKVSPREAGSGKANVYWRMVKGADGKNAPYKTTTHPTALPFHVRSGTPRATPRGPLSEISAQ